MLKTIDEKINGFLFIIIFPLLLFFMSYYGFESAYVIWIKSAEKAPDFMFESVYAYRVIPNYLSVHVTELMTYIIDHYIPFAKTFLLKNGTVFYHSTFLINAFFFILSSIILDKIFKLKPVEIIQNIHIRRMLHLLAVFFIVILQYVPTNCDLIAIFFYLSGVYFTLKYLDDRKPTDLMLLSIIIIISTFARETACLNIAFFAAVFFDFKTYKKRDYAVIKEMLLLVIAFVLPYMGLKLAIRQDASFFEGVYFIKNFTSPYNIAGLLFGIIALYFGYNLCNEEGKVIVKKYLFFSLPYLIMITLVGLFWEARLFLPLILTGIVLASQKFKNVHLL
ncbi:hypothetical protein [Chryseobacterium daecheongense]|uniref:Glycosyltransferase RgtA/B/C/D-like domain-containing protein n=1 Tax=Chryseobacterium daecheongense TaxID=192389 RepID=A0A3N0VU48_9FLAO|nr:hypothetical protein [Chryseobacterium daecheongense]ROH96343.1 hypothetical protein EGI05_17765 [Chryseobacterium daecheongense]TDX89828.1 hypothetical protein BCF50_3543 [Chryseobacterium daecheongense]